MKSSFLPLFALMGVVWAVSSACVGTTTSDLFVDTQAGGTANGNSVSDSHTATGPTAAGVIALNITLPAAAENKEATARLLDASQGVVASANAKVTGGQVVLSLESDAVRAGGGNVVFFVDLNGDSVCNIAPTDIGGAAAIPEGGNVAIALDQSAQAPCSAFGDYSLTIGGTDFVPHNNQVIYAAVKDTASSAYVTQPKGIKVQSGVWSLTFAGALRKGRAYQVQYFADVAASGKCQDHSWTSQLVAVTKDTAVQVTHDTAQEPICSTFPALLPLGG